MRCFVVIAILLPFTASAAPSTINIPATLAHDRELVAAHATDVCACKTLACARKPQDAMLRWQLDHDLMKGNRGYEAYLAAVAADSELALQRSLFDDCNASLLLAPRAKVCKRRFASAAAAFAREAPRAYAPYHTLDFRDTPEPRLEPAHTLAAVRITPGRSWSFRAVVGPRSIATDFGIEEPDDITDVWGTIPSERGIIAARRVGAAIAIVEIRSERWGDFEPDDHPLAKLFLAKMMAAGSKCLD